MKRRFTIHLTALAAVALLLFGASQAFAAATDTEADTTISNTASVTFTIGGGTPPAVTDTVDFKVDHKVRPFVADVSGATVVPNGTGYALKFNVTNDGNTKTGQTLQLYLDAVEAAGNDFSMTAGTIKVYADDGATAGSFDGTDTNLTDSASGLITLERDETAVIYIVANAPVGITKTQTSVYHLRATAYDGSGALLSEDSDGNNAAASEAVFADDASASGLAGDGVEGGQHSDSATYTANWTDLGVDKQVSDGTSGYHIPGDVITYTITVTNSDTVNDATYVTVSDPIPTNTTFEAGTLTCSSGTPQWDNGSWTGTEPAAASVTAVRCLEGTVPKNNGVADGEITMTFEVSIN